MRMQRRCGDDILSNRMSVFKSEVVVSEIEN